MTEKVYDIDSHLREFEATVVDSYPVDSGFCTILDRTAFFPEAGGQASDIGMLNDVKVYDVQIKDEVIYHYTQKQFQKGEKVKGVIDWQRRFDFMQQHSGEHIVSGVAHRLYGCENVGFHLGADIVTLDFDKPLTREQISIIEQEANEKVFQNKKFLTYYPDDKTLETLNYRSKKELEGAIRIVEIEDTDMCACCAPHVNESSEIGIIKLLDSEKIRGGVRIEMKCGRRALADYNNRYQNASKISSLLCVPQSEIALAVEKLQENIDSLKYEIGGLKRKIITEIVEKFNAEDKLSVLFQEGFDIKELQLLSDSLHKKSDVTVAVFSGSDSEYSFAICGEAESLDSWFKEFKSKLSVRGGGRGGMVQGTVLNTKEEILGVINELD